MYTAMADDVINEGIDDDQTDEVIRRENFDASGPLEIDVAIGAGRVVIALVEELLPSLGGVGGSMLLARAWLAFHLRRRQDPDE